MAAAAHLYVAHVRSLGCHDTAGALTWLRTSDCAAELTELQRHLIEQVSGTGWR